jgi:transposase
MSAENTTSKQPLIRRVNRQQMSWRAVDVERLIDDEHLARAIWALVGRLDLSRFYEGIESSAEEGGRPAFDPQLLISLWVYAYSQGIGSAREVARRCEFDPAFQWLTGLDEVNYHTLADFRVEKQQELDELFTQVLAALSKEGLITLEQVMQDGTKIKRKPVSGVIAQRRPFASIWSAHGVAWRRWVIHETKRPTPEPSRRASEHDANSKSGSKTHCKNWRNCRSARWESKPRARRE